MNGEGSSCDATDDSKVLVAGDGFSFGDEAITGCDEDSMHSLKAPYVLKYSITPSDDGLTLCIWEPASINETRVRPFLFMAKYRLETEDEANLVLGHYRQVYQPQM